MKYKYKQTRGPDLKDILKEVVGVFNVTLEDVKRKCRKDVYVKCRRIYIYVACMTTDATLVSIGELVGLEDHKTCIFHREMAREYLRQDDPEFMTDWSNYTSKSQIWDEYKRHTFKSNNHK